MEGKGVEGSSVMDRIMLKYRPIVPKPFTGGVPSDKLPKRTKRKYVRSAKKQSEEEKGKEEMATRELQRVETLQLLPQVVDGSGSSGERRGGGSSCEVVDARVLGDDESHHWLSLSLSSGEMEKQQEVESVSDPSAVMDRMGGVESWVTVECVSGTCTPSTTSYSHGFGFSEERMRIILESDACPGFISDGWNRVQWLNGAFRRMVMMTRQQQLLPEVTVWLWMSEELPYTANNTAFTCQVKLKYTVVEGRKKEKSYYSQLVPCDLWRIDGGGFAWRLDVKAALSLGA